MMRACACMPAVHTKTLATTTQRRRSMTVRANTSLVLAAPQKAHATTIQMQLSTTLAVNLFHALVAQFPELATLCQRRPLMTEVAWLKTSVVSVVAQASLQGNAIALAMWKMCVVNVVDRDSWAAQTPGLAIMTRVLVATTEVVCL